jgi:hypothetical protein
MRIDSSGNLGVGTSSPGEKLQVDGAVRIVTTGSPSGIAALQILVDATNARTLRMTNTGAGGRTYDIINGGTGAGNLGIYDDTAGAYRLVLDSSGNLGLGVTPSAWVTTATSRGMQFGRGGSIFYSTDQATSTLGTNSYQDGASTFRYISNGFAVSYSQCDFDGFHRWFTAPSGTAGNAITFTQAMTLGADGTLNLGPGGASGKLTVRNDSTTAQPYIDIANRAVSSSFNMGGIRFSAYRDIADPSYVASITCEADAPLGNFGALLFHTAQNGGASLPAERMRITYTGNLGVGTTSPNEKIVSSGAIRALGATTTNEAGTTISWSGTTSAFESRGPDTSTRGIIELYHAASNGSLGQTALQIISSGHLLSPPTYNNTSGGPANVGVASDGAFYRSTSSLKYKRDVQDATHGLTELMALRPVTYKGKAQSDGDTVYGGLIAEEVHDAGLTEFVQYAEDGSPDALAYANMVSLCIKAVQELKAEVDSLRAQLNP